MRRRTIHVDKHRICVTPIPIGDCTKGRTRTTVEIHISGPGSNPAQPWSGPSITSVDASLDGDQLKRFAAWLGAFAHGGHPTPAKINTTGRAPIGVIIHEGRMIVLSFDTPPIEPFFHYDKVEKPRGAAIPPRAARELLIWLTQWIEEQL